MVEKGIQQQQLKLLTDTILNNFTNKNPEKSVSKRMCINSISLIVNCSERIKLYIVFQFLDYQTLKFNPFWLRLAYYTTNKSLAILTVIAQNGDTDPQMM